MGAVLAAAVFMVVLAAAVSVAVVLAAAASTVDLAAVFMAGTVGIVASIPVTMDTAITRTATIVTDGVQMISRAILFELFFTANRSRKGQRAGSCNGVEVAGA